MSIKLKIQIIMPSEPPKKFEMTFDGDRISVGREKDNDVQLPLSTVSRHHAVIFSKDGEWFLQDLNSTHGTKRNSVVIEPGAKRVLRDGDEISIVQAKIIFSLAEGIPTPEGTGEKTSVIARKMVQEVLGENKVANVDPYLLIMNGPQEGSKLAIGPEVSEILLGRGSDTDFQIDDSNVSRHHAIFRRDWDGIYVEDLSSKNGVVVNERAISEPTKLFDTDDIRLGAIEIAFIDPTACIAAKIPGVESPSGSRPVLLPLDEGGDALGMLAADISEKEFSSPPENEDGVAKSDLLPTDASLQISKVPLAQGLNKADYLMIAVGALVIIGIVIGLILFLF